MRELIVIEELNVMRELYKVDSNEPITKTVYEFNGCKWHGCLCQPGRTAGEEERYAKTKEKEKKGKELKFQSRFSLGMQEAA